MLDSYSLCFIRAYSSKPHASRKQPVLPSLGVSSRDAFKAFDSYFSMQMLMTLLTPVWVSGVRDITVWRPRQVLFMYTSYNYPLQ